MADGAGRRSAVVRFAVYAGVLYAGLAHNAFWVPDGVFTIRDGFRAGHVGYDSDLVVNRLALAREGAHPLHPLYWQDYHHGRGGYAYTSQFGLPGVVLGAVYRQVGGDVEVFAGRAACAFAGLTALVLAAFFAPVARRIGPTAADVGVLLTACSPVLLPFAASLYWVPFLMLAPFVGVWLLYPYCARSRIRFAGLFWLTAAAVCLKGLCGYEYLTTVILAPTAAVVYHRAAAGDGWRRWVWPSAGVVLAGLVGFAAAVGLHAAQLQYVVGKDPVAVIGNRASESTVGRTVDLSVMTASCVAPDPWFLPTVPRTRVRCLANYLWLPAAATPATWGPLRGFASLGLLLVAVRALAVAVRRTRAPAAVTALAPAAGVGVVAALSWHLLALNHTCVHQFLNLICYFVPFALLAYALVGWAVGRLVERVPAGRFVPWVLAAAAVGGNAVTLDQRQREHADAAGKAAAVVGAVLRGEAAPAAPPGHALGPTIGLEGPPRHLPSELWFHCRVRPDFNGTGEPCRLLSGCVVGPPTRGSGPTVRVVAVAGGRVVAVEVGYARVTLLERITGGRSSCTFFSLAVPEAAISPGDRPRLFMVSGPGLASVAELPPGPESK